MAGRAHGVQVQFAEEGHVPALGSDVEAAVYPVAQEALHNALRHAGASEIAVTLARGPRTVILMVGDDGRGFVPREPTAGLGLGSMRSRAEAVGGSLEIRSTSGGTRVRMKVPLGEQG
jgi:signal transduction histidine kinase